ncbi:hypothetical protein SO802_009923 [Lithocarpus litseifolius]|uniref:Uncharacterized protein n=1 Tax=Lithocarpus litseifolius TaxID=425828 RepID=A0AAW2DID5_9ROSI
MTVVIIKLTIEEETEETLTIEELKVVEAPMVNLHNSVPSIIFNKVNLALVVLDQIDLYAKFVENLDIWLLTTLIGCIMLIRASIHLPSLQ